MAQKNLHTTPNNTHGDYTLLAHINLMSLNILKNEKVKEELILNLVFTERKM